MKFKFNVGDKVRVCHSIKVTPSLKAIGFCNDMENYKGKVTTIVDCFPSSADTPAYHIEADKDSVWGHWTWAEEWLEPADWLTISFDPSDRAAAHQAVEEAIKAFYAPKGWADDEILRAKNLMKSMLQEVFMSGGDVVFDDACHDNTLICVVRPDCFSLEESCGRSAPHGKDIYNIWIGKCVALCKALHRPIPDFIRLKNT